MLKLGTVFSGIGAIEQALKRMNIKHEVEFACDNGDIEIDVDYQNEIKKIKKMRSTIEKREYANNLYKVNSKKTNFVEQSYKANYKINNDNFFYDVKLLDGTDFNGKIDLFVGGSPCQSFSVIGSRGGFEDARGTLFYEYARLVNEIQPKVFIYENVFGVLTHDKGNTWKVMQNIFDELGYHYKWEILNAKDYGIPQSRKRLYVVGFKNKGDLDKFEFPKPKKLAYTLQDFLIENTKDGNLVNIDGKLKISEKCGEEVEQKYFLSDKLKKYVLSPGTKNFMHPEAEIDLKVARALLSTQGNTHRASVNNYVTTNGKIRALTIRETHRLMGFDDDYKIVVSKAQAYKQSGNSIVVDVLIAILNNIYGGK
ncbi:MAG: DNA cytosine methyltransferase [Bacilli bacterium]|nr:DNA cytosine methyltransferase [Bacilli bacterium]MDD4734268.1 DNA cytosine methyltransferase [Bacilli bacterium]